MIHLRDKNGILFPPGYEPGDVWISRDGKTWDKEHPSFRHVEDAESGRVAFEVAGVDMDKGIITLKAFERRARKT